jgi:hypothetical protein
MEICRMEEPPMVGDKDCYATCWWVLQQCEGKAPLVKEVNRS